MKRCLAVLSVFLTSLACTRGDGPRQRLELRLGGSSSVRDVVEELRRSFVVDHPSVEVSHASSTHSGAALTALRQGELDLVYVTREPTAEERAGLHLYTFARDPLVFVAHRGTGVTDITTQQLRDLYRGAVHNWAELGGRDVPVIPLDRPEHTSAKVLLRAGLLADLQVRADALPLERPELMDEALASYEGAIGYTSLRAALAGGDAVDVLRLNGVYPHAEEIVSGRYPCSRPLIFACQAPPSKAAREWLAYLQSRTGRVLAQAGALVPLRRELRVAVPPMRNILAIEIKYGALARYLQERLGQPVELTHTATYTDLTEAFRKNEIDASFMGSFAYLVAHLEAGVEVLARPDHGGSSHYRGVLYVAADAPYQEVEDLQGARLAHAGKTTTAGEIFPAYALAVRGLPPPQAFFGRIVDAGSHESAVRLVLQGHADVAAAKDLVVADMDREEPGLVGRLRALDASPPVPSNAFCAGPLLGAGLRRQIRSLLLSMDQSPRGIKALGDMGAVRFLTTADADYHNLYEMVEAISDQLVDYFQYR